MTAAHEEPRTAAAHDDGSGILSVEAVQDAALWDDHGPVLQLLRGSPPRIPSWYGYDAVGADLWEDLSRLPSYYPTAAEFGLIERHAGEIAERVGPWFVELGSGSAKKTRLLLAACQGRRPTTYLPVDVTRRMLERSVAVLPGEVGGLTVRGLWGRYEAALRHLRADRPGPLVIAWLGSAVGNMTAGERATLVADVAATAQPGDHFLVTADLVKPGDVLEAAYNDPPGAVATARFRLNVLENFNRCFDGDAVLQRFYPRARWNPRIEAIEGRLYACEDQTISLRALDHTVELRRGEWIVHGYSSKFRRPDFVATTCAAGFEPAAEWVDPVWQYGMFLFVRR